MTKGKYISFIGIVAFFIDVIYKGLYLSTTLSGQLLTYKATWNLVALGLYIVFIVYFITYVFFRTKESGTFIFVLFGITTCAFVTLYFNAFGYTLEVYTQGSRLDFYKFFQCLNLGLIKFSKVSADNEIHNFELIHRFCQSIIYIATGLTTVRIFLSLKSVVSPEKVRWLFIAGYEVWECAEFAWYKLVIGVPSVYYINQQPQINASQAQVTFNGLMHYLPIIGFGLFLIGSPLLFCKWRNRKL